ncbi:hypothetical protein [Arenibacter certesii]|uniref:hypothetical protein n=1 Tax=Arenibacter certesii TaxID=228955 RepID=UPI001F0A823E|nr:hypothetical protein [Arenibacter certesii]
MPSLENEGSNSKSVPVVSRFAVPLGSDFFHKYPAALNIGYSGDVDPLFWPY